MRRKVADQPFGNRKRERSCACAREERRRRMRRQEGEGEGGRGRERPSVAHRFLEMRQTDLVPRKCRLSAWCSVCSWLST